MCSLGLKKRAQDVGTGPEAILDILILHEASTYPGVVLPCRPLGVVEMDQEEKNGKSERNDRVIVMPAGKIAEVNLRTRRICRLTCEKKSSNSF